MLKKWGDYFSVGLNGIVQVDDTKSNVSSRVLEKQYKEAQAYVDGFYNLFNDVQIDPIDINFGDSASKSASSSADELISEIDLIIEELEKYLQDKQFEISVLEFNNDPDSKRKIIEIYKEMQAEVHKVGKSS